MKTFLFIFLAGYAVKCDSNYYVVRMPQEAPSKEFKVYWNVPTMQCTSKKIPFDGLYEKYGIIQNTNDTHRGDKISILYDPGNFPALIKNETTGEIKFRNGGVPQQGSLLDHIQVFKHELVQSIPDENFSGVGIIDFESWRPIFRQNFGVLTPYKNVSYEIERKRHWWWKNQWIQDEAKRRFEEAGRDFMQTTIILAKKLRPKALWGYYGFPECFNRAINNLEKCANGVPAENDQITWLWSESTALFPSVYSTQDMTSVQLAAFIRGRIKESDRVRQKNTPILPYWWFRYRDAGYFTQKDLDVSFSTFYKSKATGFIIWGSSQDVNTKDKCLKLRDYVTNTLGPTIAKYTKSDMKIDVMFDETSSTVKPEDVPDLDLDYNWVPFENYTQNIEHSVEESTRENVTKLEINENINESALISVILHKIANYCSENCQEKFNSDTGFSTVDVSTKDPFKGTSIKYGTPEPATTEKDDFEYVYADTSNKTANKDLGTKTVALPISNDENNITNNSILTFTEDYYKYKYNSRLQDKQPIISTNIEYTTKSITENSTIGKMYYLKNFTAASANSIDDDKSYFSSSDISTYYDNSTGHEENVDRSFTEASTTDSSREGTSTIIWSTFSTEMENIVNTSVKMETSTIIGAVNTTADPVLTEQVVVSVV